MAVSDWPAGKVSHRNFAGRGGKEHFLSIRSPALPSFREQLAFVEDAYRRSLRDLGLSSSSSVFRRVFVSDILNQGGLVKSSSLTDELTATSIVQQPPLPDAKIELLAYHIDVGAPLSKRRLDPAHLLFEHNGQRHLWSTGLCAGDDCGASTTEEQTDGVFKSLVATLHRDAATLKENCVRTWIYLKDVDVFYRPMVAARKRLFAEQGMTESTHYIASTGIEGACGHPFDLVAMDAYSQLDLKPGQMSYLDDFERLCPTKNYNVTFERGTRIDYADRSHLFISGTASIDAQGQVVHPGDVLRQAGHALDNVEALLHSGGAKLADLMYLIVYLRDRTDFGKVNDFLRSRLADIPIFVVQGSVCRPAWLIELEGVAIKPNHAPHFPAF